MLFRSKARLIELLRSNVIGAVDFAQFRFELGQLIARLIALLALLHEPLLKLQADRIFRRPVGGALRCGRLVGNRRWYGLGTVDRLAWNRRALGSSLPPNGHQLSDEAGAAAITSADKHAAALNAFRQPQRLAALVSTISRPYLKRCWAVLSVATRESQLPGIP